MDRNHYNIDWGGWILTIIMLGAFWPIGLVLLFRQLMGYSKRGNGKNTRAKRHPYDLERERQAANAAGYQWNASQPGQTPGAAGTPNAAQNRQSANGAGYQWNVVQPGQTGGTAAQTPGAAQAPNSAYSTGVYGASRPMSGARPVNNAQAPNSTQAGKANVGWDTVKKTTKKEKSRFDSMGQGLTIAGSILTGLFGIAILATLGEYWGAWSYIFSDLFPLAGFFGAGLVCLYTGRRQRKKGKRYKKYLAYIGKNQEISISALASAMGVKEKVVYEDLQEMLDNGILPMGYIDVAEGQLILSDRGIAQPAPQPEPAPEPVKKTVADENAILQEIREVNDAIPDAAMSAKIDRIGEITGKILDYQRSHPSKSGQLRSFLNYYLPTTLKILRAYAQLDAQGIEGENITAAKKRIENMMDQVVDGFEKQLDKLFADDALDITADVAVLENMLRKDGLSGDGMIMGGGPLPAQDSFSAQQAYLDLQKVADELDAQAKDKDDGQITLQL